MGFIKNTIGVWLLLFPLILPFPYFLISPILDVPSDAELLYWFGLFLLPLALVISGTLQLLSIELRSKVVHLLEVCIAYILAYFLLKYGMDKLLLYQFYTPEGNILFTPVGQLSKDILFWSTMGSSTFYNLFMGLVEIIPGLLLLHRRTRMFGAFCSFGVLLHVFMINIGFDISVKLLSLYLLLCSIYLLSTHARSIFWFFFVNHGVTKITSLPTFTFNPSVKRFIKGSILVLFVLDTSLPYFQRSHIEATELERNAGSYVNSSLDVQLFSHDVKRIHLHSKGYFIIEDFDGNFFDERCSMNANSIFLIDKKLSINIEFKDQLTLFSWWDDNGKQFLTAKKIDSQQLPFSNDSFHWTLEGMVSETIK